MPEQRSNHVAAKSNTMPMLFVVGLAMGAAITAMITPKNGTEMRRSLHERAQQAKHNLERRRQDAKDEAANKLTQAQEAIERETSNQEQGPLESDKTSS